MPAELASTASDLSRYQADSSAGIGRRIHPSWPGIAFIRYKGNAYETLEYNAEYGAVPAPSVNNRLIPCRSLDRTLTGDAYLTQPGWYGPTKPTGYPTISDVSWYEARFKPIKNANGQLIGFTPLQQISDVDPLPQPQPLRPEHLDSAVLHAMAKRVSEQGFEDTAIALAGDKNLPFPVALKLVISTLAGEGSNDSVTDTRLAQIIDSRGIDEAAHELIASGLNAVEAYTRVARFLRDLSQRNVPLDVVAKKAISKLVCDSGLIDGAFQLAGLKKSTLSDALKLALQYIFTS